jgi:hypothetical protein
MNPLEQLLEDIEANPLIIQSVRGFGKSVLTQHLTKMLIDKGIIVYVFDSSLKWMKSPTKYIQIVDRDKILSDSVENSGNCTYILASMSTEDKRSFIATIIKQVMDKRIKYGLDYGYEALQKLPLVCFVIEESNLCFSSSALRGNNPVSEILLSWISQGRNARTTAILVTTVTASELSTSIRRRSIYLSGKLRADTDINNMRKVVNWEYSELCKSNPPYHFLYSENYDSYIVLSELLNFNRPERVEGKPKPIMKPQTGLFDKVCTMIDRVYQLSVAIVGLWLLTEL